MKRNQVWASVDWTESGVESVQTDKTAAFRHKQARLCNTAFTSAVWVQEPDLEVLANMLEAIQDTVRLVGPSLLTLEQLSQAFERFRVVLDESAKRRKGRCDITTGEDFDDEEAEALEVSCT